MGTSHRQLALDCSPPGEVEGLEGLRRQVAPQKSENKTKTKTTVAGAVSSMEVRVGIPLFPFFSLGE